jgi:hypothetical protein
LLFKTNIVRSIENRIIATEIAFRSLDNRRTDETNTFRFPRGYGRAGNLLSGFPVVPGGLEIYFPVSPWFRAGWKFTFRFPRGSGLAGNLFSGFPVVPGWLEIYFPVSPWFRAGWKFIFRFPRGSGLAGNLFSGQTTVRESPVYIFSTPGKNIEIFSINLYNVFIS